MQSVRSSLYQYRRRFHCTFSTGEKGLPQMWKCEHTEYELKQNHKIMANYYCEYCGHKFPDVRLLVSATCVKHPDGSHKGKHKLYEGSEKSEYICKYCGRKFSSIMLMTSGTCANHPKGSNKGGHAPTL